MKRVVTVCCQTRIAEAAAFYFRDQPYCQQHGRDVFVREFNAWERSCGGGHI